ncbi:MAG: restriction endonuclease [Ruminococcus sp.]|nr:restriction endonuclease [Ruminococcus sp.]
MKRLNYIGPLQDSLPRSVNISEQDLPAIAHFLKTNYVPLNVDNESHEEAQLGKVSYASSHSILEAVDNMSSHGLDFELFTVDILKKNGFEEAKATQSSGDYGIDVIAKKDGISYAIQCKCYSKPVGNKAVQEAYSGKSFYDCMIAVVFTNNYFTKAAKETAQRTNVLLWDRTKLIEFINNAEY